MHLSSARVSRAGFTLVELAIVLVIIGLIVGGVLAGATLIRNAEMRAIITERDKYETAINTFRLRFKALPGDMATATTIWGAADPDPATCYTIVKQTEATCNGTGNKRIWDLADNASPIEAYEMLLLWHHLGNAGLIGTNTTGAPSGSSMLGMEIGVNLPVSKIAEGSWMMMYTGSVSPGQGAAATPQAFDGE